MFWTWHILKSGAMYIHFFLKVMYYVWGMFFADWALCSTKHVAIKQLFNTGKTKFKTATKTGHCRKIIELEHNSFLNWSFIGHGIQHITIWLHIDIKITVWFYNTMQWYCAQNCIQSMARSKLNRHIYKQNNGDWTR